MGSIQEKTEATLSNDLFEIEFGLVGNIFFLLHVN